MAQSRDLAAGAFTGVTAVPASSAWRVSWPVLAAAYVYLLTLYQGNVLGLLLLDGDTYWHIATGHWIVQNGAIPAQDPFSHTMRGAPWTAHEWLSQVILAWVHDHGGWDAVIGVTGLAFAGTTALLMRALLSKLEPIRAVLFTVMAVLMTTGHLLARPHMLALPLMMIWVVELVNARDEARAPKLWLLPVMVLWANMHGGFTLGLALAAALGFEAVLDAWREGRWRAPARRWGLFLALALASALVTPHGPQALWFTWQVLVDDQYALARISEWSSPNFHQFQPLELWLLGGLAVVLHQGLKLPPVRLVLLLGLLHLALKHVRNIEMVGLLTPLLVASAFGAQWRQARAAQRLSALDRVSARVAETAGRGAVLLTFALFLSAALVLARVHPAQPPEFAAPVSAIKAAKDAGVAATPVLNGYGWGGYLIYSGIAPAIDGRSDMYRDAFLKAYLGGLELSTSDGLEQLLEKYRIGWTLLPPGTPAIALLDRLPGWRRIYADKNAVVHGRTQP